MQHCASCSVYIHTTQLRLQNTKMRAENRVIARIFKYARLQQNLTQIQFARQLNIHQSTLSRIENGREYPMELTVRNLEATTGKKLLDLVRESRLTLT